VIREYLKCLCADTGSYLPIDNIDRLAPLLFKHPVVDHAVKVSNHSGIM
jgi:hypothetical protein